MKALALAAVLLAASSALADHDSPRHPGRPAPQVGTQVVVDRDALEARLARLERLLFEAEERGRREGGRGPLRRAQEELGTVRRMVAEAAPLGVVFPPRPQTPPPAPVVQPIEEGKLQRLGAALAREGFADNKLRVLQEAAPHHHFLVGQVSQLLQHFPFSDARLEAVRLLRPRILDTQNAFQLYAAFPHSSDKQLLRELLAG